MSSWSLIGRDTLQRCRAFLNLLSQGPDAFGSSDTPVAPNPCELVIKIEAALRSAIDDAEELGMTKEGKAFDRTLRAFESLAAVGPPGGNIESFSEAFCRNLDQRLNTQKKKVAKEIKRFKRTLPGMQRGFSELEKAQSPRTDESPPAEQMGKRRKEAATFEAPPPPPVELLGPGDPVKILGKEKPPITTAQYNVVKVLLEAGSIGLSKDELVKKSGHEGALKTLKGLAKEDDWKKVISLAGKAGMRYRITDPQRR